MNRQEAAVFRDIFISRGIFVQIDPEMDALDILQSYEDLSLPDALDRIANRFVRGLEHKDCGRVIDRHVS